MEKNVPHCKLAAVRTLIEVGRVKATSSAYEGARQVSVCDLAGMCAVILALKPANFYKSMTTYADHRIWQDVYQSKTADGRAVYLKLTIVDDVLIVSFKGVMTMKCPCCGATELIRDTRDISYTYKGETTSIPEVTGEFCPACSEVILEREQGDRYAELVGLFQRQVNAAYVDPSYIATVRRKLELDQRQAAELFGGGVNAFSRYENGKTKPPLALVKLFRLLDRHPDLLSEVKTA